MCTCIYVKVNSIKLPSTWLNTEWKASHRRMHVYVILKRAVHSITRYRCDKAHLITLKEQKVNGTGKQTPGVIDFRRDKVSWTHEGFSHSVLISYFTLSTWNISQLFKETRGESN